MSARFLTLSLLILLWSGTGGLTPVYAGGEGRIVLIMSQDAIPYRQAAEGFQRYLTQAGVTTPVVSYGLEGDANRAGQILPAGG